MRVHAGRSRRRGGIRVQQPGDIGEERLYLFDVIERTRVVDSEFSMVMACILRVVRGIAQTLRAAIRKVPREDTR